LKLKDAGIPHRQLYLCSCVDDQVFQQSIGIPMATNGAPLLTELLFVFIRGGISKPSTKEEKITCCDLQFNISIDRQRFIYEQQAIPFIC
jgi:hypothetical protein